MWPLYRSKRKTTPHDGIQPCAEIQQQSVTSVCGKENWFWEWQIEKMIFFSLSIDFLSSTHTCRPVIMTSAPCKIITGNCAGWCAGRLSKKLLCVELEWWQIWSKGRAEVLCVWALYNIFFSFFGKWGHFRWCSHKFLRRQEEIWVSVDLICCGQ